MKKYLNTILLGLGLITLSVLLHGVHYYIFRDLHHIMIYLIADIAFIPLEVFIVSVVLERVIEKREDRLMIKKLNMLVGLFYQEVGDSLLTQFVSADKALKLHKIDAAIDFKWDDTKYKELAKCIKGHKSDLEMSKLNLMQIDRLLTDNKEMIVSLITNPTIHEHGAFSDVLMSLFHLADELKTRPLEALHQSDIDHLKVDSERIYRHLAKEWVNYMCHLQVEYPYLFLAAVKTNPFDPRHAQLKESLALETYTKMVEE